VVNKLNQDESIAVKDALEHPINSTLMLGCREKYLEQQLWVVLPPSNGGCWSNATINVLNAGGEKFTQLLEKYRWR
jgi:hypothetical protein